MRFTTRKSFVKFLYDKGYIDEKTIDEVLKEADIIDYLVKNGIITEFTLLNIYKEILKDVVEDIKPKDIDKNTFNIFPQNFILNNKVIPYKFDPISETLYVLTYEPYINISIINTIKFIHKIANLLTVAAVP